MRIKLQTRITLIYALIFTLVLVAVNAAVFLIVRFYNTGSDNINLMKTRTLVEAVLRENGRITEADLLSKGIRYPFVVQVRSSNQEFSSIPDLEIIQEGSARFLRFHYLGEPVLHRASVMQTEFLDLEQRSYLLTFAKSIEESTYNRRVTLVATAVASLLGMLLSLAVGSYMSHESFNPINNMRRSVESIGAANMSDRISVPDTGDELTDLGNTFNSLLDRMESAYKRQSKFVSDASHELRTPLTVIQGYVGMLDRWGKQDPEILEEAISAIKSETRNMNNLVENLLFIAKGENRKLNLEPERFDLLELVKEVTQETKMSVIKKNIIYTGEPLSITADRNMLKQLLRVFIENSVKFTAPDGTILTKLTKAGDRAIIKVWDNGEGIAPKDLGRVFERFYVADKARAKDKSGSGLGLSIAKWIVEVHKGEVKIDSKLGEFTEICVSLPLAFQGGADPDRDSSGKPA